MKLLVLLMCIVSMVNASSCEITCWVAPGSKCSISCPQGETAYCYCMYGNEDATCICRDQRWEDKISVMMNNTKSSLCKSGCSPSGGECRTDRDCCYQCTGVSCYLGTCQPNACLGRGAACDSDCQCCSSRCERNEVNPGVCT